MAEIWETMPVPQILTAVVDDGGDSAESDSSWKRSLSRAIRQRSELLSRLGLKSDILAADEDFGFPVLVPESYLRRMKPGDPDDPLLRQVLPNSLESVSNDQTYLDPVGDLQSRVAPGLLHKYSGRVLLIAHGSCAVHCRYCFRRHYPYHDDPKSMADWEPAIESISADASIQEVILSGGDPLLLSNRRFKVLLERLERISHLKRVRIHSRLPIVLPDRVDSGFIKLLTCSRLQPIMVVHANHPRELLGDCEEALRGLVRSGIPVLNQAVLLRGINDDVDVLSHLCLRCVDLGVMPYYLHQLDRVRGAIHLEVEVAKGQQLIEQLRSRLPGYAVPRYVTEIAGESSKTPL